MTFNSLSLDRVTLVGLALAAALPFLALSPTPARAATTVDCAAEATALRSQAEAADPKAAARAMKLVRVAEKICAEGGRFEAVKKFAAARAQIDSGVQLAARR